MPRTPGANTITLSVGYSTAERSGTLYCALILKSLGKQQRAKRGTGDYQSRSAMVEADSIGFWSLGVGRGNDQSKLRSH
jgi:hypothetical protein